MKDRLTYKEVYEDYINDERVCYNVIPTSYVSNQDCLNKLGQLEDIEDELSIELTTLFKAIKNGVWVKNYEQGIHYISLISWNCDVQKEKGKLVPLFSFSVWEGNKEDEDDTVYLIEEYGKTWALTKEELENK